MSSAAVHFDAEHHSEITVRSKAIRLAGDGQAEVDGELATGAGL